MIERILHVGPYGGHAGRKPEGSSGDRLPSNAYLRSLAFERLGYEVRRIDSSPKAPFGPRSLAGRAWRRAFSDAHRAALVRRVSDEVRIFAPDLIFIEKGIDFERHGLAQIRQSSGKQLFMVHMNPDDPFGELNHGWSRFIGSLGEYDLHLVPKEQNREEYLGSGAKRVLVFDRSFDPQLHRPVALSTSELAKYGCDLGFIGSFAPHRESVLADLVRSGIQLVLWGSGWSRGKHWSELRSSWRGGEQVGDEYTKALCGMKIALHFLRRENRDLQDSRTFEIPACGTFMLAERTKDHERLFSDGIEAVYFDTTGDLTDKVNYYLKHDDARQKIAERGYARTRSSGYDHDSRLLEIMKRVADALRTA